MVYYGFYNSLNHDRVYDAVELSSIFDGIISDGVYATYLDHLMVRCTGEDYMVRVGPGRAWFNHSWLYNDSILVLQPEQAELIMSRIDVVVLEIDTRLETRANRIFIMKGAPATNPVPPVLTNDEELHQYPLAYINIEPEASTLQQANITNAIGTTECPFVTGIIEHIHADDLILQWENEWEIFMRGQMNNFTTWFETIRNILSGDVAGNLLTLIQKLDENLAYVNFADTATKSFEAGEMLIWKDTLYTVLTTIQTGDQFIVNTNITKDVAMTRMVKMDVSTIFLIDKNNWSANVTTESGVDYYTYDIPINHFYAMSIQLKASGATENIFPTKDEKKAASMISEARGIRSQNIVRLFAEKLPTIDFYIMLKGVD